MSDDSGRDFDDDERPGTVDWVSVVFVLGGIPCMILFFLILFTLVGSCDASNIPIHA